MKVLFIYKYLTLGGVEAVLRARLAGLPAYDIDAYAWFLSDGPGASLFEGVDGKIRIGDVEELEEWLREARPEIVSIIDTEEVLETVAELGESTAIILEVHSPYRENRVYLYWLTKGNIQSLFVPSRYQADVVQRRAKSIAPVRVIPNPLPEVFATSPRRGGPAPPSPVVAWVGRLDALKDWRTCIRAFARIRSAAGEVELWIIGEPQGVDGESRLYDFARGQGVLPWFRWYPSIPHRLMPRWFDAVRESGGVVLSTSREESFGMSVAEAMARACAVVVPDTGPFPEYVEPGVTGLHYPLGDASRAARAAGVLLEDSEARQMCGERARESILASHAPEVALRILADELQRVAHTARR